MFERFNHEFSTVSEFIDKKSKSLQKKKDIIFSKVGHVLHGEHEHYFSKQDVLEENHNARCVICGMLLAEFKAQQNIIDLSPRLKAKRNRAAKAEKDIE